MFHVPNRFRTKSSDNSFGNNGQFIISHPKIVNYFLYTQASDGGGWEHVSVSVGERNKKQHRCPTWGEMCYIKNLFWDEEDCIIQFHPAKSEYVNVHEFVLYLWRPTNQVIPIPLKEMIG